MPVLQEDLSDGDDDEIDGCGVARRQKEKPVSDALADEYMEEEVGQDEEPVEEGDWFDLRVRSGSGTLTDEHIWH